MSAFPLGGDGTCTGTIDRRLGIITHQEAYNVDTLQEVASMNAPIIGITIPCVSLNYHRTASGKQYQVVFSYEGHIGLDPSEEYFEIDGTVEESPIETHVRIVELMKIGGVKQPREDGRVIFPTFLKVDPKNISGAVALPDGRIRNPKGGIETFKDPSGITWTRHWVSRDIPGDLLHSLGKISTPRGAAPSLEGNANWLKIRVQGTFRGNVWQFSDSHLASDEEGWDADIYSRR